MCDDCSTLEAKSFPSEQSYIEFDSVLTDRVFGKKNVRIIVRGKFEYVYECIKCQQLWELRTPDLADRGYLKPIN